MAVRECPDCGRVHICRDPKENYSRRRLVMYVNGERHVEMPYETSYAELAKLERGIPNVEIKAEEIEQSTGKILSSKNYPPSRRTKNDD